MTYKPRATRNRKSRGRIPVIAYQIAAAVVALLVSALLPSDPKVKHVATVVFVSMILGGLAVFGLAMAARHFLRRHHGHAESKGHALATWAIQLSFTVLAAGLIALFYTAILKQM